MVQVHTVYGPGGWRNKVDGLVQSRPTDNRNLAVSVGRSIAVDLFATHDVHDIDDTILSHCDYGDGVRHPDWSGALQYTV